MNMDTAWLSCDCLTLQCASYIIFENMHDWVFWGDLKVELWFKIIEARRFLRYCLPCDLKDILGQGWALVPRTGSSLIKRITSVDNLSLMAVPHWSLFHFSYFFYIFWITTDNNVIWHQWTQILYFSHYFLYFCNVRKYIFLLLNCSAWVSSVIWASMQLSL